MKTTKKTTTKNKRKTNKKPKLCEVSIAWVKLCSWSKKTELAMTIYFLLWTFVLLRSFVDILSRWSINILFGLLVDSWVAFVSTEIERGERRRSPIHQEAHAGRGTSTELKITATKRRERVFRKNFFDDGFRTMTNYWIIRTRLQDEDASGAACDAR